MNQHSYMSKIPIPSSSDMSAWVSRTCAVFSAVFLLAAAPIAHADFIGEKGHSFSGNGAWWYQSFTVSGSSQTFTLYFTSRYSAAALIAPQSQISNFTNNNTVSYIDGFSGEFGVKNITLSPGSYFLGVRNRISGSNAFSVELEEPIASSGATYVQAGIQGAETVSAGGYLVHDFTIQDGYRYIIDGNNSGNMDIRFIPRSEKSKFTSNQGYTYYTGLGGVDDPNEPGLATINLNPGDYTMAVRSTSSTIETITYRMHIFRLDGSTGGQNQSGSSGYSYYSNLAQNTYAYYSSIGQSNLAYAWYYYYQGNGLYLYYYSQQPWQALYNYCEYIGHYYFYSLWNDRQYANAYYKLYEGWALAHWCWYSQLGDDYRATFFYNHYMKSAYAEYYARL